MWVRWGGAVFKLCRLWDSVKLKNRLSERGRGIQTDRQTGRQADRDREIQRLTDRQRQRDTQTDRQAETNRETDREIQRHRDTDRQRHRESLFLRACERGRIAPAHVCVFVCV